MTMTAFLHECDCTAALIGIVSILGILYFFKSRRPRNFPPGPSGLPIVGYMPFLGKNGAETLRKMKAKYGPVMSIQMGMEDWIVLNDYESINEGLAKQGEKFSGRPSNYMFDLLTEGYGLIFRDYGPAWKTLRKFGLMTLRGFGVGKKGMEENVIEETPYLIENLTTDSKDSLGKKLTMSVSNIICRVAFGSRFSYDDQRFQAMIKIMTDYFSGSIEEKLFGAMTAAPVLRHIPPFRGAFRNTVVIIDEFLGIFRTIIAEHKKTFDENDIRDFIDAFLKEMKEKGTDSAFSEKQLLQYIRDLFEAGTETTSTTLTWAMLAFVNHPESQESVAKEIEDIIGENGVPTMKHRDQMPYTCAFIQELMRYSTLVPLSVIHKTNAEANVFGYTIPKNTTVVPNLWAVHNDPDLFENPTEFRPERFLDENGKFVKSNHVIAFSIGPRHCLGEQLARMELFIFLTGIVQKLKILPDSAHPPPSLTSGAYTLLSTYKPPDFKVKFEKR